MPAHGGRSCVGHMISRSSGTLRAIMLWLGRGRRDFAGTFLSPSHASEGATQCQRSKQSMGKAGLTVKAGSLLGIFLQCHSQPDKPRSASDVPSMYFHFLLAQTKHSQDSSSGIHGVEVWTSGRRGVSLTHTSTRLESTHCFDARCTVILLHTAAWSVVLAAEHTVQHASKLWSSLLR